MNKLLIPISDDNFKAKVNIRFNNILDGLYSFKNFTLAASDIYGGENKLIKLIEYILRSMILMLI